MSEQKLNEGAGVPDELLGGSDDVEALKARIRELEQANQAQRAAADGVEEKEVGVATASSASTKERYAIIVEEGGEANAIKRVPVQVNGRAYLIERGKRVEVPPEVVHVLENAVVDKSIPVEDERTGLPNGIVVRPTRRFPFQNLGKVVDADGNRLDGKIAA
jgi:hypothetical protein